ncbi:hypothetical protein [Mesorhizobium sangaii]|uniref:Uncharacterized protein n=1 Tax=Mesorhizobium sangaii TaxID=505389 RepID=A0A841PVS5_9HYPH|nr:hypothetical protein [Mesorhizobium sangaii]MBB6414232.1 hypothetical protein [Mesorhizobium sangaii]
MARRAVFSLGTKSVYVQAFQTLKSEKKLHSALVFVSQGFVRTAAMESVLSSVPRELTNCYNNMNEKVGIEIEAAAKIIAAAANGTYDHRTDIVYFSQR